MIDTLKRHEVQVLRRDAHVEGDRRAERRVRAETVRRIAAETDIRTIMLQSEPDDRVGRPSRPTCIATCWRRA